MNAWLRKTLSSPPSSETNAPRPTNIVSVEDGAIAARVTPSMRVTAMAVTPGSNARPASAAAAISSPLMLASFGAPEPEISESPISLMAANGDAVAPRSMTMMGGPIDTRRSPTSVNNFATGRPLAWFESRVIQRVPGNYPGVGRRVYPGFLQHMSFIMMNADRHIDAHREFFGHLVEGDGESAEAHRRFYDEYNAVLDMAAEYYLETLRVVFKEHALPNGTWDVRHQRVEPAAISQTALFTIEGELDDISGVGQTEAAHGLCTNIPDAKREHFLVPGVGHYGIFSGRRYREQIYPRIREFIRTNA